MKTEILAAQIMLVRDLVLAGIEVSATPIDGVCTLAQTDLFSKADAEFMGEHAQTLSSFIKTSANADFVKFCVDTGVTCVHMPEVVAEKNLTSVQFIVRGFVPDSTEATC